MIAGRQQIVINPVSAHCCPFCGSSLNYMSRPGGRFAVLCAACRGRGPVCDSPRDAIARYEKEAAQ